MRCVLPTCLVVLSCLGIGCPPAREEVVDRAKPDRDRLVVLVTVDAFRADMASGGFEELASSGVAIGDVWGVSPLSRPSLATVMTAFAPDRTRVRSNVLDRLPEDVPTLASRFLDAGWSTTAIVGSQIASYGSGLSRGFELFDGPESTQVGPEALAPRVLRTAEIAARFASWLPTRAADRPAFVWLHLADLHSAAPSIQAAVDPLDDYRSVMKYVEEGIAAIIGTLRDAGEWDRAEVVFVGLYGIGAGHPHPVGATYWMNDETLRATLVWKGAGPSAAAPLSQGTWWLPDVPQTLAARAGLEPIAGADGEDRRAGSAAPSRRMLWAWNWALDDELAWPTLTAVRSGDAWDIFEWDEATGAPAGAPSDALDAARARPATPRERRLSAQTRARLKSIGVHVPAASGPARARVVGDGRDAFLSDVLRVRSGLSYGVTIAARKASRRIEEAAPDNLAVLSEISYFALIGGALDDATTRASRAVELYPDREQALHAAAHAAIGKGELDRAEVFLAAARELGGPEADLLYDRACLLARRGDVAGSFAALDGAIAAGFRNWTHLEADPDLAAIRSDPAFAELLRGHGR